MSFETSPYQITPTPKIPQNITDSTPEAEAVASSLRDVIKRNNTTPSIEAGTFSVEAIKQRQEEHREDIIIAEIEDQINSVLDNLTSSNRGKIQEIKADLEVATRTKDLNLKAALLESLKSNVEMTTAEAKSPIKQRFALEISNINNLASGISQDTAEILTKFDELLIEEIGGIEALYITELNNLKARVEKAINKLNPNSAVPAGSTASEPEVTKTVPEKKKFDSGVKSVSEAVEALDLRIKEIKDTQDVHARILEENKALLDEISSKTVTIEELKKDREQTIKDKAQLESLFYSEMKALHTVLEQTRRNDRSEIEANFTKKQEELLKGIDTQIERLNKEIIARNAAAEPTQMITADDIDPLKDGEEGAWEYKAPGSGDIDLSEIPEGEKGTTSNWANNGDGNDEPIEEGLHDIAPADRVIDGEFKVINEGEVAAAPTAPSIAKAEPEIKNTYFSQINEISKLETKVFEYKFSIDGQEYVINNLPDFVTFVKLQDNRILNKNFDPSTIANTSSGFAFKSTAVRAIKLEKLRAGIPVKLEEYDLKNLLKHSFKKYIEQLQQVKVDHEANPNMVAENMYKAAMDQTMYDFGNPTETATTTNTAEAPQAQEAGSTEEPTPTPESAPAVAPAIPNIEEVSTPAPEQAPEAEPSITPMMEKKMAKGLELQWDEEDREYYANFKSDLHRITSNEIVDEGTIKAVKSKLEAALSQIETEEKGGAGTARFYYLKESINTYLELINQKLSVTDSGAAAEGAVDAAAKDIAEPAQNRNPFADEPELVVASPATVSGAGVVPEESPAADATATPSEIPSTEASVRDFGSILDPIKFKDVEASPKLTQKEIDEFKAKFNMLIGSEWGPVNPTSPYPFYVDKIIPDGLIDRANKGALTPEESKEAIKKLEAIAAQIADWKSKSIVAGELDDTIRTIEIVLNRIRSIEYDKVTKEAEIKSVEAEVERFKTSKEYSDAISLANNPISTFTSNTPALHTRLAEIEESIDILTQLESSIRAVDSKNKFLLELNKIINTLENRALDIEKAMPAKYAREMKEMSSGPINKAALVNDSERGIGRIDSISTELNAALNSLDDMIARPELTDAGIRIQIIAKKAEIDSALDRLSGIKDKFEKSQKAADKLSTQKVEANRLMSKLVSSLTIADKPDQINDNLAQLDRLIQTDADYSELEALDPDHAVIRERAALREKIEAYLTALGGRKVELEQQAKIEAFKTEITAIESEMKAKFDELNDDMERVYAGVIPDMTTIPDEDSDETPLSADRRALLAQRWEEYRIGRMRWKTQAIALNDQFKGRLDALRSTIYSVRVPLNICKKFADTELAINKKFIDCRALEKVNPYVTPINKAMDIMIKRGIKFTKIDSFDQIKNGVKQGRLARLLNLFRGR